MPSERCGAKTRQGGECTQWAVSGAKRCRMHGGKTKRAAERVEQAKAEQLMSKALGTVPDTPADPVQVLIELLTQKQAEVQWLRAVIRETDPQGAKDGLVWGLASHEEGVGPEGPIDKRVYQARPSVWWDMLRKAEDQLEKFSGNMIRNGLQQRQLELQEAQALHLAQAIHRILDQLGLSQEQAQLVPTVVPQVLRALPTGDSK